MKIRSTLRLYKQQGYALILTMCTVAVALVVLSATLNRTTNNATLNNRNNQYQAGLYAAEAATEKVIARMKYDFVNGSLTQITNNLASYRDNVPTSSEDPYWSRFQFNDATGNNGKTYVQCTSAIGWGALSSQYGLFGWTNVYRVISNTKQLNTLYSITNAVLQDVEMDIIPVFQYAIFYNGLLEFTWTATLTINGRVHANTNIFVGSASDLTFNSLVTAAGGIYKTNWDGHTTSQMTGDVDYNNNPGYLTNTHTLTLPIGTNNTAAAVRELINIPPSGEDVSSAMGQQRYYNKAGIVLLVSNSTVTVQIKSSATDTPTTSTYSFNTATSNYTAVSTNLPFLNLTNSFTDPREGDTVKLSEIDVALYSKWLSTNSTIDTKFPNTAKVYNSTGAVPNILYVADFRANAANQLKAVRLKNGAIIPTNWVTGSGYTLPSGFTVATPNPLYVMGNYNLGPGGSEGSTNTSTTYPASLISDALTILSSYWSKNNYTGVEPSFAEGVRVATNTTVNAAILTGIVYSTGASDTTFSGGAMNLPRLLEDWDGSGTILTLNTSIVNLFDSAQATSQFRAPGGYYYAPWKRQFSFDPNFLDYRKLPPGTPLLPVINRIKWATPPPNNTTYAGNN